MFSIHGNGLTISAKFGPAFIRFEPILRKRILTIHEQLPFKMSRYTFFCIVTAATTTFSVKMPRFINSSAIPPFFKKNLVFWSASPISASTDQFLSLQLNRCVILPTIFISAFNSSLSRVRSLFEWAVSTYRMDCNARPWVMYPALRDHCVECAYALCTKKHEVFLSASFVVHMRFLSLIL